MCLPDPPFIHSFILSKRVKVGWGSKGPAVQISMEKGGRGDEMMCLSTNYSIWELFFVCVFDWIEAVIFDIATNIETSFSLLCPWNCFKTLKLTESSCFWIVTSQLLCPIQALLQPFPCKWDVHIWYDGQLYLLFFFFLVPILMNQRLRYMSLKFELLASKNSIPLWNRPWQNSVRCNGMMPCLTWLAAFLGGMGPILPDPLQFHCT